MENHMTRYLITLLLLLPLSAMAVPTVTVQPSISCSAAAGGQCSSEQKMKDFTALRNNQKFGCAVGDGVECTLSTNKRYKREVNVTYPNGCYTSTYNVTGRPTFVPSNVNHAALWGVMWTIAWVCDEPVLPRPSHCDDETDTAGGP